jgi:hypothetical protein
MPFVATPKYGLNPFWENDPLDFLLLLPCSEARSQPHARRHHAERPHCSRPENLPKRLVSVIENLFDRPTHEQSSRQRPERPKSHLIIHPIPHQRPARHFLKLMPMMPPPVRPLHLLILKKERGLERSDARLPAKFHAIQMHFIVDQRPWAHLDRRGRHGMKPQRRRRDPVQVESIRKKGEHFSPRLRNEQRSFQPIAHCAVPTCRRP